MAAGDIGATIETVEVDANLAFPRILHIAGDVYAIVYRGADSDGFIKTYSIDATGDISAAALSTLEFDTNRAGSPTICHISGDHYAIAYEDAGGDGRIKTLHISDAGVINPAIIDNQLFSPDVGGLPHMVKVAANVFLSAFTYTTSKLWVRSIGINDEGTITNLNVSDLEVDTNASLWPRLAHIAEDIFAICYYHNAGQGRLFTVSCNAAGAIAACAGGSVEFEDTLAFKPEPVKTVGGKYAIVYQGPDNHGFLKTWEIGAAGAITDPPKEIYEFDNAWGEYPVIKSIGGEWYAIAYENVASHGNIRTIEIKNDGDITTPYHAEGEFYAQANASKDAIQINNSVFAVVYSGSGAEGFITTKAIEGVITAERRPSEMMMMGMQ
ncbi:hypothetical protein ES707_08063 [subsurface metagenome]